jgi:hypothetical protein
MYVERVATIIATTRKVNVVVVDAIAHVIDERGDGIAGRQRSQRAPIVCPVGIS